MNSWQETLRAMERLVDIFRRATVSTSGAKNPLTAGAAERREWQYEDAGAGSQAEVPCNGVFAPLPAWLCTREDCRLAWSSNSDPRRCVMHTTPLVRVKEAAQEQCALNSLIPTRGQARQKAFNVSH